MARKRRKLNPELEKNIAISKKEIELITAKIHDIYEDDIQEEYKSAFTPVVSAYLSLSQSYKEVGYNDDVLSIYQNYLKQLSSFKDEYEL